MIILNLHHYFSVVNRNATVDLQGLSKVAGGASTHHDLPCLKPVESLLEAQSVTVEPMSEEQYCTSLIGAVVRRLLQGLFAARPRHRQPLLPAVRRHSTPFCFEGHAVSGMIHPCGS